MVPEILKDEAVKCRDVSGCESKTLRAAEVHVEVAPGSRVYMSKNSDDCVGVFNAV